MTAFVIDLSKPQRAYVASDSLGYTLTGKRHEPLGFATKVQPLSHVPGAWFGIGLFEIQVRAYSELLLRPELMTHAAVVKALPEILLRHTAAMAVQLDIEDPAELILFVGFWLGYDHAAGKVELVVFDNSKDYEPMRGYGGTIGMPNISAEYMPPGLMKLPGEARVAAAMRAQQRFIEHHGEPMGQPPIGGAIMVTEIGRHGVSTREVAKFADYQAVVARIAKTQARVARGEIGGGIDLVHRAGDKDEALARVVASVKARRAA